MPAHPLQNWIPARVLNQENHPVCRWLYAGHLPFAEPFFDETLGKCLSLPDNSRPYTVCSSLAFLETAAAHLPAVAPMAFIFHVSRCGSTLLSQLLDLDEANIVLSEVPLLDQLLRLPETFPEISRAQQETALQAAIRVLGQKRTGHEKQLFIKLDSWHVFFAATLRKLYPSVPFILLYRAPDEVFESHRRHRGMQAVPGVISPEVFGFSATDLPATDQDAYTAQVLERYFRQMLQISREDANAVFLPYPQLNPQTLQQLGAYFNWAFPETVLEAMAIRGSRHAKFPGQAFVPDPKPRALFPALEPALALYHQLNKFSQLWQTAPVFPAENLAF